MSRKMITSLLRLFVLSVFAILLMPVASFSWGNPELLIELNDTRYLKQDFIDWWQIWKEEQTPLPETPDDFIDWMLLSREAENMQLYDRPTYRNKVAVYLRVRSLMQLKYEEIDSKISTPSRDDLWPLYQAKYLPRFNLKLLSINTDEVIQSVSAALSAGLSLDEAAEQAGLLETEAYLPETGLMRPSKIPAPLLETLQQTEPGETGGPVSFNDYAYFFEVLARDEGTDEDFATLRKSLARQWQKQQVGLLTAELLKRLKDKYPVEVDDELVAGIGLGPLAPEVASQVAVKIDDVDVTAQMIQESFAKDFKMRYGKHGDQEELLTKVRQRVIADMLSQTLTAKEAMARHYEEQEPLSKNYRFYCQNRLIKELEQQVIAPQALITEADIESAYQKDIILFTRKGLIELIMVQTVEKELARLVEEHLMKGEDFNTVVAPLAPMGVKVEKIPLEHLQEPVKDAVANMREGQVSRMIPVGEELFFVKLIRKGKAQVTPLEQVRNQVESNLKKEKFQEARSDLVEQLRERSHIKVKSKAWKQVVEQLNEEGI